MVSASHSFTLHRQASLFKYVFKQMYFNFYLSIFTAVSHLRTCRPNGTSGSMEVRSEGTEHLPPHLEIRIEKTIVRL